MLGLGVSWETLLISAMELSSGALNALLDMLRPLDGGVVLLLGSLELGWGIGGRGDEGACCELSCDSFSRAAVMSFNI